MSNFLFVPNFEKRPGVELIKGELGRYEGIRFVANPKPYEPPTWAKEGAARILKEMKK